MTGVVTSLGELSLAGLYALGAFPQGFRPALGVTAAVRAPSREGEGVISQMKETGLKSYFLSNYTMLAKTKELLK